MMIPFRPQFFNFPFNNFYNYRPPNYYTYNPNHNQKNTSYNTIQGYNSNESRKNFAENNSNFLHEKSHHSTPKNTFFQEESQPQNKSSTYDSDEYFFELFGLKLYFDDVLLICLLFFLYQEGVKDQELFISLILLLLS